MGHRNSSRPSRRHALAAAATLLCIVQAAHSLPVFEVLDYRPLVSAAYPSLRIGSSYLNSITDFTNSGNLAMQVLSSPLDGAANVRGAAVVGGVPVVIDSLSGGSFGRTTGINENGTFVGFRSGATTNAQGSTIQASWIFTGKGSSVQSLPTTYLNIAGADINDQGDLMVSGRVLYEGVDAVQVRLATGNVYTNAPMEGYKSAFATQMNNNRTTIGWSEGVGPNGSKVTAGTVWRAGGASGLGGSPSTQYLRGLNNRDWVVGSQKYTGGAEIATLWVGSAYTALGVMPGFAGSFATDINDNGVVVGFNFKLDAYGNKIQLTPFVWQAGKMESLAPANLHGTPGLNYGFTDASNGNAQINNAGQIALNLGTQRVNEVVNAVLTPRSVTGDPGQKDHLIIVTHGWQPGATPGAPLMPKIYDAINARLSSQINAGSVKVLDFQWKGGMVSADGLSLPDLPGGKFDLLLYGAKTLGIDLGLPNPVQGAAGYYISQAYALNEGRELGRNIASYISSVNQARAGAGLPAYAPTLHFIGADLGTITNTAAIRGLAEAGIDRDTNPIQFTILNAPPKVFGFDPSGGTTSMFDVKSRVMASSTAFFYYKFLGEKGASYVDNYYTDSLQFGSISGATFPGQPIPGAGPCVAGNCSGALYTGKTATQLQEQIYPSIISGTTASQSWVTPALLGDDAFPNTWDPEAAERSLREAIAALPEGATLSYVQGALLKFGLGGELRDHINVLAGTVTSGQNNGKNFIEMVAHSPVAFSFERNVDGMMYLEFDYDMSQAPSGELGLLFNNQMLWAMSSDDDALEHGGHAVVSLAELSGTGQFVFLYNSTVTGSSVRLSDLTFHGLAAVPEASTTGMLAAGLFVLGWTVRRRQRSGATLSADS